MGRSRQSERTRRQRSAARKGRTSAGLPMSNVDWQCPHCAQWFSQKRNGPGNHLRFCKAHRSHRQRQPMPLICDAPITADSLNDTSSSSDSDSLSSSSSESNTPVTHKRRAQRVRSPSAAETSSAPNDCPGAGHTAYEELLGPANLPSQLDEGEIWIEYHPASGKHPEILRPQGLVQCVVPPVMPYDATTPPWHPFRTRADFEQAELFLRYDCTDSYINGQLKLIHSSSPLGHNITLESSKEMHATLAQIPRIEHLPGFITVDFEVPYPKQKARNYSVRFRESILPAILDILEDEHLQDLICLYPERRYMRRPGPAGGIMRLWEEYSSGDDWWDVQTLIGPNHVIIYLQLYIDSTHVTSFGNVKYWGVFLWIGNVPKADHNDQGGRGRAILVAYLPSVVGFKEDSSSKLAIHCAEVYHTALGIVFADLELPAEHGTVFKFCDTFQNGIPIFMVVSADYEEMVRISGILGSKSLYPCPICLVPKDKLSELGHTWPARTKESTDALITKASWQRTKEARKNTLASQSLRYIYNIFLAMFSMWYAIFKAFILDHLHAIEQGEFGKHLWPWFLEALPSSSQSEIDQCFQQCPRFPGVHHFKNGVTSLKYITGAEHGQILRYLSPFINNLWPEYQHHLLRALRHLACIHLYVKSFTVHSDISLESLQDHINQYDEATKELRNKDLGIEFEWYKHHSLDHAIDIIRKKGPTDNYEPGLGESLHPQVKADYERSSHHPHSADMQMTRMAEERDSILRIRAKVDSFDEWEESLDARPSVEPENPLDSWVLLCAPQKPVRVQDISSKLAPQEFRCSNFASRLVQFLHLYAGTKINVKRLQSCSIRRYHSIQINYVCMMSAAIKHDILRATPRWRKTGPRYDCALINGNSDGQLDFVKIYGLFSVRLSSMTYRIALIHRFRFVGRHPSSEYIELQDGNDFGFIFVDTIIRVLHILPPSTYNHHYTVQDLQSPDMHLRLELMH